MAGVEAGCRAQNLTLLYETLPVDENHSALEVPRVIQDPRLDGLILAGGGMDERLSAALRQRGIPAVLVEGSAPGDQYDSVAIENEEGAYQAARHLIEKGHRQIAFLGGGPDAPVSLRNRRQGYVRALTECQLQPAYGDCPHTNREAILATTCRLLNENPRISAILCCTDEAAIIALHAARMAGKQVPQDLSIVGFDDIAAAENSQPPLTTMQVDKISLGRLAVQLIINRAENPNLGRVTMHLHTSLIERQSVRDIRGDGPVSETALVETTPVS
jgi:LacI family transcriptional regulator